MASTSAFAAVKNGASLKGNEYSKGGNNAKGGGVVAWNEYSSVDPTAFSHDLSSESLTVLKDGDYLVAVTAPFYSTGERNTHRAELLVNGTAVSTALGQSTYIRITNGHTEASANFAVLVSLKANDTLTVKTTPIAAVALDGFIDTVSLYAELVGDERNVFSGTATTIQSGDNLNVDGEEDNRNLVWTGSRKGSAFSHSDGNPDITLKDGGNYMVYINIPLNGSIARASVGLRVSLDDEPVEGALGQQGYIRNTNAHKHSSIHFAGVITAEAGQVLKVDTALLAKAGVINVQGSKAASIYIEQLGTVGLYADTCTETVAGQNLNAAGKTPMAFLGDGTSEEIIDNATYSNEGDSEENIVIKQDGDYLLSFNVDLYSGNGRINPRITVEVNGSEVSGATSTAHYIRNADGHNESSGAIVALLNDLVADDVVTVSVEREGNAGTVNSPEGGKVSLLRRESYATGNGDSPPKITSFFGLGLDGFQANIEDFGLSVDAATIKAVVNGTEAAITSSKNGKVTAVNYAFASIPAPKSVHAVTLSYSDSAGNSHSHELSFAITL
ncbi:MAG TPA: hypothetical protein QGH16_07690, partial [Verrucomicrobiota bacterium]|nr:hypothetical protein [Verrucomicrobiota bacterium]